MLSRGIAIPASVASPTMPASVRRDTESAAHTSSSVRKSGAGVGRGGMGYRGSAATGPR